MGALLCDVLGLLRKPDCHSFHTTQARLYLQAISENYISESELFDDTEFYSAKLLYSLQCGAPCEECLDLLDQVYRHANDNFHFIFPGALSFLLKDLSFSSNKDLCNSVFSLLAQNGFNDLYNKNNLLIHKLLASHGNLSETIHEYYLDKGKAILESLSTSLYLSDVVARRLDDIYLSSVLRGEIMDAISWANNPLCSMHFFKEIVSKICKEGDLREMFLSHIISSEGLSDEKIAILNDIVGKYNATDFEYGVMSSKMMANISRKKLSHLLPKNYYLTSYVDSCVVLSEVLKGDLPPNEILSQYDGKLGTGTQSRFTTSERIKIMSFLNASAASETFEEIQGRPFSMPYDLFPNNAILSLVLCLVKDSNPIDSIMKLLSISDKEVKELASNYIVSLAKSNYKFKNNITPPAHAYNVDSVFIGFDFEKTAKFITSKLDLDLSNRYIDNSSQQLSVLEAMERYSDEKEYLIACHINNLSEKMPSNAMLMPTKRKTL